MGKAALIGLRRDHPDIVRKLGGDAFQRREPIGIDAVVIGDENAHQRGPPIRSRPPIKGRSTSGTVIEPSSF